MGIIKSVAINDSLAAPSHTLIRFLIVLPGLAAHSWTNLAPSF
jgi:hypothetical protein